MLIRFNLIQIYGNMKSIKTIGSCQSTTYNKNDKTCFSFRDEFSPSSKSIPTKTMVVSSDPPNTRRRFQTGWCRGPCGRCRPKWIYWGKYYYKSDQKFIYVQMCERTSAMFAIRACRVFCMKNFQSYPDQCGVPGRTFFLNLVQLMQLLFRNCRYSYWNGKSNEKNGHNRILPGSIWPSDSKMLEDVVLNCIS